MKHSVISLCMKKILEKTLSSALSMKIQIVKPIWLNAALQAAWL